MALVKRGARLITVDGVAYRWRVRKRPAHTRSGPLSFAVERADRQGAVLLVTMPGAHPDNWAAAAAPPVIPSMVGAMIRQALARGWRPERPGPVFALTVGKQIWAEAANR